MTTCLGKEMFFRFTANAFRKLLLVHVFNYFPFGFRSRLWDLIISVPDRYLSFYFSYSLTASRDVNFTVVDGCTA